jgi:magnesium-transporting ATPase (P-type)
MTACNNAELDTPSGPTGDPTEIALLQAAAALGYPLDPAGRPAETWRGDGIFTSTPCSSG